MSDEYTDYEESAAHHVFDTAQIAHEIAEDEGVDGAEILNTVLNEFFPVNEDTE